MWSSLGTVLSWQNFESARKWRVRCCLRWQIQRKRHPCMLHSRTPRTVQACWAQELWEFAARRHHVRSWNKCYGQMEISVVPSCSYKITIFKYATKIPSAIRRQEATQNNERGFLVEHEGCAKTSRIPECCEFGRENIINKLNNIYMRRFRNIIFNQWDYPNITRRPNLIPVV